MKFLIKLLFPEPELGINQHMRRVLAQDATNALEQTARQISAELSRGPGDVALELAVFGGKDVS